MYHPVMLVDTIPTVIPGTLPPKYVAAIVGMSIACVMACLTLISVKGALSFRSCIVYPAAGRVCHNS